MLTISGCFGLPEWASKRKLFRVPESSQSNPIR